MTIYLTQKKRGWRCLMVSTAFGLVLASTVATPARADWRDQQRIQMEHHEYVVRRHHHHGHPHPVFVEPVAPAVIYPPPVIVAPPPPPEGINLIIPLHFN